jgi:hypothetical protein
VGALVLVAGRSAGAVRAGQYRVEDFRQPALSGISTPHLTLGQRRRGLGPFVRCPQPGDQGTDRAVALGHAEVPPGDLPCVLGAHPRENRRERQGLVRAAA